MRAASSAPVGARVIGAAGAARVDKGLLSGEGQAARASGGREWIGGGYGVLVGSASHGERPSKRGWWKRSTAQPASPGLRTGAAREVRTSGRAPTAVKPSVRGGEPFVATRLEGCVQKR